MPTLKELESHFLKRQADGSSLFVENLWEADGILFLCPKCYADTNSKIGTHSVICWFVGHVADDVLPKPGRWTPQGTCLEDLTFIPSEGRSHSVHLTGGGCGWHGFITDGKAE